MSRPPAPGEPDCRRPDFAGGTPVRLADGQLWTLPTPTPGGLLEAAPGGAVQPVLEVGGAPDPDTTLQLLGFLDRYGHVESPEALRTLRTAAAAVGLRRNYHLTHEAALDLVHGLFDDPDPNEVDRAFIVPAIDLLRRAEAGPPSDGS